MITSNEQYKLKWQQPSAVSKKIASIITFLALFYIIPLSGKPQLLIHWQIILLAGICTVLFITQPRISISESKEKFSSDRNTVWLILIVSGIGQVISVIEWAYFRQRQFTPSIWTYAGIGMLIAGTAFRLYSINALGKYFSATVQVKVEHRIISKGPYKILRHPSYTGAYIAMLGCAVFLQSITGVFIFGIGMLFVYHLRIKTEERTLIENFKEEYLKYREHTYKMFPLVW